MYPAGDQLDSYVADAVGWPTTAFTASSTYPYISNDNLWRRWWKLEGVNNDPTRTVLVSTFNVELPYFSTDIDAARAAATRAGMSFDSDDPVTICNGILSAQSYVPESE